MRTNAFTGLIALSVTALMAGVAAAQSVAPPPPTSPGRHMRPDADKDRKISQAEFVQAHTARLTALDANHDGTVSPDEVEAARAQAATARFDRLDTDKNGEISRSEFDAAHAQRPEAGRAGRGEQRMARHAGRPMGPNGPNGEGRHGPAERMAMQGPMSIADAQTRATEAFTRLDTNHDGFLTADEMRAERAARGPGQPGQAPGHGRMGQRMSRPMAPAATPASPSAPASE